MIELWLVDLEAAAPALEALEQATPRLSEDDCRRAGKLVDGAERRQRRAAYIALRVTLERAAGAHIRQRAYRRTAAGKPYLADGQLGVRVGEPLAPVPVSRGRR